MMIDARSFQRAIVAVGSAEDVAPLISEATDVIAMSGGLDRDLTSIPAHEIAETQVLRTIVGGRVVFSAAE